MTFFLLAIIQTVTVPREERDTSKRSASALIRIAISATGIALCSASHAMLVICARSMPPSIKSSTTMPPMPRSSSTLLWNHARAAVFSAPHR